MNDLGEYTIVDEGLTEDGKTFIVVRSKTIPNDADVILSPETFQQNIAELKRTWTEEMANFLDATPRKPVRREGPRIGRNDQCPCGSGRKFKKCCISS
jgi:uncharacterized protein YchJ